MGVPRIPYDHPPLTPPLKGGETAHDISELVEKEGKWICKPGSVPFTNTLVEVSIIYLGGELPPRSNNLPSKIRRVTLKPWFI